ncbi:LL-diaminopimelate aminotransferase [Melghiribacillus thermohalophilus]|uniref:Aminotransferase n=1 Tax=Melghiribacillus thermohalophilus TaxID=1324956 RepID=A0A4R3N337_9BACI|nr:LL-diaminopimelate aminotransferase [Melghiribacillus thermohalophilus]TCT23315.1 LL-diaminopimelate aminotransferase [Melghiribacillus thermohalophilus]
MNVTSDRVKSLPPYIFSRFQQKKKELEARGVDVIDLGIGAPDLPTPDFIIEEMYKEAKKPENHRYSPYKGCKEFREAVASFYQNRFQVELDPETEVLTLIGSKEGIAHLISAVTNPGDSVLIPDPGYPVYQSAVYLAGAEPTHLPLNPQQGYTPAFEQIPAETLKNARLMLLNYPGNPTAATAELDTFLKAVSIASTYDIALAHDSAYNLVTFDGYEAPSLMQVPGAKNIAVEFGSLSKSFNMTGWRIGYVVGNQEIIRAISTVKSNVDTGQFLPIQKAAARALTGDLTVVRQNNAIYKSRMEKMADALQKIGIHIEKPRGTFFIWAPVPEGYTSMEFADRLLEETGVIVTPGTAFGPSGEGYFRLSLSVPTDRLEEAVKRMNGLKTGGDRK